MKKVLLTLAFISAVLLGNAQEATESSIEIAKVKQACATANFNFSADLLEEALRKRLSTEGLGSGDKSKGFRVYKKVNYKAFGETVCDIYIKIDGKKDNSTATIAVSKGYDNFVSGTTDAKTMDAMKAFLNSMPEISGMLQLEKDIEVSDEAYKKAVKNHNESKEEGEDLAKQHAKIEEKIAENKTNQSNLGKEVEKAKDALEALKAKKR
jgi:hypothetical protein